VSIYNIYLGLNLNGLEVADSTRQMYYPV